MGSDPGGGRDVAVCTGLKLRWGTHLWQPDAGGQSDVPFPLAEDSLARGSPARLPTPSHPLAEDLCSLTDSQAARGHKKRLAAYIDPP